MKTRKIIRLVLLAVFGILGFVLMISLEYSDKYEYWLTHYSEEGKVTVRHVYGNRVSNSSSFYIDYDTNDERLLFFLPQRMLQTRGDSLFHLTGERLVEDGRVTSGFDLSYKFSVFNTPPMSWEIQPDYWLVYYSNNSNRTDSLIKKNNRVIAKSKAASLGIPDSLNKTKEFSLALPDRTLHNVVEVTEVIVLDPCHWTGDRSLDGTIGDIYWTHKEHGIVGHRIMRKEKVLSEMKLVNITKELKLNFSWLPWQPE